jgi:hypothetical protein
MLPEGIAEWFEVEHFEKTEAYFRIYLTEKNIPPFTSGKKITNTILKRSTVDDFPVRGRKVELVIKRRYWKLEGEDRLLKRDLSLIFPGTRLEKEFGDFLKAQD